MAGKPKTVTATKTIRQPVQYRPGLDEWFDSTKDIYNKVVEFYFDLYQAHPLLLEMSQQKALSKVESLTTRNKNRPNPAFPLDEIVPYCPAYLRRAAINAARGAFKSFYSNLKRWRKQKAKFETKGKKFYDRPPLPPRRFNQNVTFYNSGMSKERTVDSIMLKLKASDSQAKNDWKFIKLKLSGRQIPEGWQAGSSTLVRKGRKYWLHTPIFKKMPKPDKAIEQVAGNPTLRICSVDLNINDALAVCTIREADGTVVAATFIRGGRKLHDRRKRLLARIGLKRSQTGIIAEGETDNKRLWEKLRHINDNEAHRISRRITDFAGQYGAAIIVFEHLGRLRPQKGRFSKRGNEKRAYWLKGKIVKYTRYKAWEYGLLTCRVSPAYTSQDCHGCGHRGVARFNSGQAPLEYQPGAPLFFCPECLRRGNADWNASINVGHRFFARFYKQLWELMVSSKKDAKIPIANEIILQILANTTKGPLSKDAGASTTHAPESTGKSNLVVGAGPALPPVSLSKMRLNGRGHATSTGENVYEGVPEEAHPL